MDDAGEFDAEGLMAASLIDRAHGSNVHDISILLRVVGAGSGEMMLRRIGAFVALDGSGEQVFPEGGGLLDDAGLETAARASVLRALQAVTDAQRVRDDVAVNAAFRPLGKEQQDTVIWALARRAEAMEQAAGGRAQLHGQSSRHRYHLPVADLASHTALAAYIAALAANGDRTTAGHAHRLLEELFGRDKLAFGAVITLWLFVLADADPDTLPDTRALAATEAALYPDRPPSFGHPSAALQIIVDFVESIRDGYRSFPGHEHTLQRVRELPDPEQMVFAWQTVLAIATPLDLATLDRLGVRSTRR